MIVTANDQGIPEKKDTIQVTINILRDNNDPSFFEIYNFTIPDTFAVNTRLVTVQAIDLDLRSVSTWIIIITGSIFTKHLKVENFTNSKFHLSLGSYKIDKDF